MSRREDGLRSCGDREVPLLVGEQVFSEVVGTREFFT